MTLIKKSQMFFLSNVPNTQTWLSHKLGNGTKKEGNSSINTKQS